MDTSVIRLLQLCSQALPVGAYAYSQAQESAIQRGIISDRVSAYDWIGGLYQHSIAQLDLPALLQACRFIADDNVPALQELTDYVLANRETNELYREDIEIGRSMRRLLDNFGVSNFELKPIFITQFALAGHAWHIQEEHLLQGFAFNWLENQVMVVSKSLPLGQSQAQALLMQLTELIPNSIEAARILAETGDFGLSLSSFAILSSQHEHQASRLYRS